MTSSALQARTNHGFAPSRTPLSITVFSSLFLIRTLSDSQILPAGLSSGLNLLVAALAIVAGFLLSARSGASKGGGLVPAVLVLGFVSFLYASFEFGLTFEITSELIRLWSILGMAVISRTVVSEVGAMPFAIRLVHLGLPAVSLLVVASVTRLPVIFSGSGRAFGTFQQTNAAAAFVALYSCLVLYVLLRTGRRDMAVILIVALAAAASTLSLGGIVALLTGTLVLLFGSGASLRVKVIATAALAVVASVAAASGALTERLKSLETTVSIDQATSGQTTNSLDWRFYNWKRLIAIWHEHPLQGWGMGATNAEIQPIGKQPHSEYVRILVEFGILGSSIAVVLLAVALFSLSKSSISPWGRTLALAVIFAVLVNAIVSNTVSYVPAMYLFVAVWAVGVGTDRSSEIAAPASEGVSPSSARSS